MPGVALQAVPWCCGHPNTVLSQNNNIPLPQDFIGQCIGELCDQNDSGKVNFKQTYFLVCTSSS